MRTTKQKSHLKDSIIYLKSPVTPKINATPTAFTKYFVNKPKDLKQFETDKKRTNRQYTYDKNYNRNRTKVKLYLAPVHIIGNQFGVFAGEDINPKGKAMLGCYAGKRFPGDPDINSRYLFQLTNDDDEVTAVIDGARGGDWTALINSSQTPNVYSLQETINGQEEMCFYVCKPIKKGEQLLYDYGPLYFDESTHHRRAFYLNADDDGYSHAEKYQDKKIKKFYAKGVYQFDEKLIKALQLNNKNQWLIPQLFLDIANNDMKALAKHLSVKNTPIDLVAYAIAGNEILPARQQQHLTALMFACYLGNERAIKLLIKHGAEIDRCMLVAGFSPFVLLLRGHASDTVVEKLGPLFLRKMLFHFVTDRYGLTYLHYAMQRNALPLIKTLFELARESNYDFFEHMYPDDKKPLKHLDVDDMITSNQVGIVKLLLRELLRDEELETLIKKKLIFKSRALAAAEPKTRETIKSFLKDNKRFQRIRGYKTVLKQL